MSEHRRRVPSSRASSPHRQPSLLRCEALEDRTVPAPIAKVHDLGTADKFCGRGLTELRMTVAAGGVAAGHAILVEVALDPKDGVVSVTDTAGNKYSADADASRNGQGVGVRTVVFSSIGAKALRGGDTIVVHTPKVHAAAASATEFVGITALDRTATAYSTGAGSTTPSSGLTDTTRQANELLIGAIGLAHSPRDGFTSGAGYTMLPRAGTSGFHSIGANNWGDDGGEEDDDRHGCGGDDDCLDGDDGDDWYEQWCEGRGAAHNVTINPEYGIVSTVGRYQANGRFDFAEAWSAAICTYKGEPATTTATTTVVTGSTGTAVYGQSVSFTATVTSGGAAVGVGSVTFTTGTTTLATVNVNTSGQASFTTSTLAVAGSPYTIKAVYNPVGSYLTSSGTTSLIVTPATATITVTPYSVTYDALAHTATGSATGVGGANLAAGLNLSGTTHTAAGAYTDTWTFHDPSGNYRDASGTVTDTISQATAAITVAPYSVTYDALAHTATGSATGVGGVALAGLNLGGTTHTAIGTYSDTWTFHDPSGNYRDASGTVTDIVTVGAPRQVVFTTQPSSTVAGSTISPAVQVSVQDAFGNLVTTYSSSVSLAIGTNPGGGILSGTLTVAAVGGVATFNSLSINKAGVGYTLVATSSGLTSATSSPFDITGGTAVAFTLGGFPSPTTAGDPHTVTLTAVDAFGNVASAYRGSVRFSSSDPQAALPTAAGAYMFTAADAGAHTFTATLKTVGTRSITAADIATPTLTATQSGIVVVAGATATFLVTPSPTSTVPGVPVGVTVTATDAFGNLTPGYAGTVRFSSSDGQAVLPGDYTFLAGEGGTHTFPTAVTFSAPGRQSVVVSDTQRPAVTGSGVVGVVGDHYDFNWGSSPTAAGYIGVLPADTYAAGLGFGWSAAVQGLDRTTPNDLLRDGNTDTVTRDFFIDHPNGTYTVRATMGDAAALTGMTLGDGTTTFHNNLSAPAGQFLSAIFTTTVTNGRLAVRFGGGGPNWVVNALDIYPGAPRTLTITGPAGAAPADGTSVDTFTGTGAVPGDLVTIAATRGSITSADADATFAGVQVVADAGGNFSFTLRRPTSGSFTTVTAQEVFAPGLGSANRYFIIPDEYHFAVHNTGTPTAAGYSSVVPATTYAPDALYGWSAPVQGFDRGTTNPLLSGGNFSTSPGTFLTDLPAGTYWVTVTMGDATIAHDNMSVIANGSLVVANLASAAGQFPQVSFPVTVGGGVNGQLALQVFNSVGNGAAWVLNAIDLRPVSRLGGITFSGPGVVPADGSSTVTLTGHSTLPAGSRVTVSTSIGTVVSADADPSYAGNQVLTAADGSFTVTIQSSYASGIPVITASSVDQPGAIAASGPTADALVLKYVPAAVRRFDFNGPNGTTAAGFIGVPATAVGTGLGYGWVTSPQSFDRLSAPTTTTPALYQDGAYDTVARTFQFQVTPGGRYNVRAYVGDAQFGWSGIQLQPEGGGVVAVTPATLLPGQFVSVLLTATDANADGVITITLQSTAGLWVCNGLDVWAGAADPGRVPQVAARSPGVSTGAAPLSSRDLAPIVSEAVARWAAAGLSADQLERLAGVRYEITDLSPLGVLGLTGLGSSLVQIDATAVGAGWFVDPTPGSDEEFVGGPGVDLTAVGGAAAGHYDLLTVVEHELGHVLGLDDLDPVAVPHDLLTQTLEPGVRRLPAGVTARTGASLDGGAVADVAALAGTWSGVDGNALASASQPTAPVAAAGPVSASPAQTEALYQGLFGFLPPELMPTGTGHSTAYPVAATSTATVSVIAGDPADLLLTAHRQAVTEVTPAIQAFPQSKPVAIDLFEAV